MGTRFFPILLVSICFVGVTTSAPEPGDVFREYMWFNEKGDAGQALRVGGKRGESYPDRGSDFGYVNAAVTWPQAFDLEYALRAEVIIEKILCHEATRDLALRVNDHEWITIPECENIPTPQWMYQHHTYPVIPIPLKQLKAGPGNRFQMKVSPEHPWNWPQNLINGVHVRIYYDPARKAHPKGRMVPTEVAPYPRERIKCAVELANPQSRIRRVDYVGLYEDVNFEGDGVYRQWHYHYLHGEMVNHIGTAEEKPWDLSWITTWVPDQSRPMQVAARIVDDTDLVYMTQPQEFELNRPGVSVELCKPYNVPQKWVTRAGEKSEHFDIKGDLKHAKAMQLVWSSWSPGYMNGLFINEKKVFDREGPNYAYYAHRVTVDDVSMLRKGQNSLKTGKTPKHNGKMVHGMEVNWPGIMVLVRYENVMAATLPLNSEGFSLFDGKTMGLWQKTDFYGQEAGVTIENESMILHRGQDMTGITWNGPLVRMNYTISLEAKRVAGSDFFCGLTFPVNESYCTLVLGGWGGYLVGLSNLDGYDAANNSTSTSMSFENDIWYPISVRVTPNRLHAWIGDEEVVDIDPSEYLLDVRFEVEPSRPLGIATWQTTGAVRKLWIKPVSPAELKVINEDMDW